MIFFFADKPDVTIPAIVKCIDYLQKNNDFVPGQTEELGEGIRCTISSYETVDETQAIWEAHRKYIDVHCVIQGEERITSHAAYRQRKDYNHGNAHKNLSQNAEL